MKILLDTHILLWWLADDDRLEAPHRALIADPASRAYVSSISIAEISIKSSLGKLRVPGAIAQSVVDNGFEWLDFTAAHAEELRSLPWHHRDPFDRMLIVQALTSGASLMTEDEQIRRYAVNIV